MKKKLLIPKLVFVILIFFCITTSIPADLDQQIYETSAPVFTQKITPLNKILAEDEFDFNDGTCQGWFVDGPRDEDGDGPFLSHFSSSWADAVNYPSSGLSDPVGDNNGSYKICNTGGHGITNPGAEWWAMYYISPDLSANTSWQNADGYSVKIYNYMELIGAVPGTHLTLHVNFHVTIYDEDEERNRYFRCYSSSSEPAIENHVTHPGWISMNFNWSGLKTLVSNYTVKDIMVSVWGDMDDYFEGGIYLDEVKPLNFVQSDGETKLFAGDGEAGNEFGRVVDISGDYAVAGAPFDDNEKGTEAGAAYIFHREGDDWVEQQKIIASDGAESDWFGYSVGISGDYVVVGSCWDDDAGEKSGSAYIFKRNGTTWTKQAKLTAEDAQEDNRFGITAAISGDYVIVGAFFDEDYGTRSGSAYIFKRDGISWSQKEKLTASDAAEGDWFGISVSIDGDYATAGSQYDDNENGNNAGAVYVFKRTGTDWIEQQKLIASDGDENDCFHQASISGNRIVVRACSKYESAGVVYLFERDGTEWSEATQIYASDSTAGDKFGACVSIYGDYFVVGAGLDDDNGDNSGSIYVFSFDGYDWAEETKIIASEGEADDRFGCSVGIDQNYIIAGARQDDDNGSGSGSVYIYDYEMFSTDVEIERQLMPETCYLEQNYPNPFNPQTNIGFMLPEPTEVAISIYDITGRLVQRFHKGKMRKGYHTLIWNAADYVSGTYFIRMKTYNGILVKKCMIVK